MCTQLDLYSDNKEVSCHKYKCFNTILSLESETNTNTNMKKICTNAPIRCIEFKNLKLVESDKNLPPSTLSTQSWRKIKSRQIFDEKITGLTNYTEKTILQEMKL